LVTPSLVLGSRIVCCGVSQRGVSGQFSVQINSLSLYLLFLKTGELLLGFGDSPTDVFAIRILHRQDPAQVVRVTV